MTILLKKNNVLVVLNIKRNREKNKLFQFFTIFQKKIPLRYLINLVNYLFQIGPSSFFFKKTSEYYNKSNSYKLLLKLSDLFFSFFYVEVPNNQV